MRFHFTIDVDWIPGSESGLQSLYEVCARHEIKATLFVAGKFAEEYPSILREGRDLGFDIGCHGMFHGVNDRENFRFCGYDEQYACIEKATEAIDKAVGFAPKMFRAPNLWTSETMLKVLEAFNYELDSSVPARRFDFGYGQCNYTKYFSAPLSPYHPSTDHLGRPGKSKILEVPPSAFGFVPVNMSALRVFGFKPVTWAIKRLKSRTPVLVFYSHPAEFVSATDQFISDKDPKRYREGLGPQNIAIVDRLIEFVKSLGYQSAVLSDEVKLENSK